VQPSHGHGVSLTDAARTWGRIGCLGFGGPAGQIALMHRILVDEKRWIDEKRFLHALNYCMLLPGPEAQQLATYVGWLLHGWRGGLIAGTLFVLPGFFAILALSVIYATFQEAAPVAALFFGLKAATAAVVVEAVVRIGRRALGNGAMVALAALAFIGIFLFHVPFPMIVLGAGLAGLALARWSPQLLRATSSDLGGEHQRPAAIADHQLSNVAPTWGRTLRVAALGLVLWGGPLVLLALWLGPQHVLIDQAAFFSKAAVVTFGGAYAVLSYVAQQAVEVFGWLRPGEMLDGLGMAETTPGPLILVLQFVGFLGAFRSPAPFDPLVAGTLGALVTVWVTFVPSFFWIFLGAPYIEQLRGNRWLSAALSAITAAVVGVILNLALWFALHVAFARVGEWEGFGMRVLRPELASADVAAITIGVAAGVALIRYKKNLVATLAVAAAAGAIHVLVIRPWIS